MSFKHTTKFQTKDELRAIIKEQDLQLKILKGQVERADRLLTLDKNGRNAFIHCQTCERDIERNDGRQGVCALYYTLKKNGEMREDYHFCTWCRYESRSQQKTEELLHGENRENGYSKTYYRLKKYRKPVEPEYEGSVSWDNWSEGVHKYEWDDTDDWVDIRYQPVYIRSIIIMQKMIRGHNQRWKCPIFTFKD